MTVATDAAPSTGGTSWLSSSPAVRPTLAKHVYRQVAFRTQLTQAELALTSPATNRRDDPADCAAATFTGERCLQVPLLSYLESCRWVRHDTLIVHELPWHGRHVDMVTRTKG